MKKEKPNDDSSSLFQRQRVDLLLSELLRKFPVPQIPPTDGKADDDKISNTIKNEGQNENTNQNENANSNEENNVSLQKIKQEPPEKRMKM